MEGGNRAGNACAARRNRSLRGRVIMRVIRRVRTALVVGIIVVAMAALNLLLGCDLDQKEPVAYYGPAPVDTGMEQDASAADLASNQDVDEAEDVPDIQIPWEVIAYYGPVPVDIKPADVADIVPEVSGPDAIIAYYGPVSVDISDPMDVEDVQIIEDIEKDCPPMGWYGPPPCASNQDCVTWYGQGWVCDLHNSFDDPCGGTIFWPTCKPVDGGGI